MKTILSLVAAFGVLALLGRISRNHPDHPVNVLGSIAPPPPAQGIAVGAPASQSLVTGLSDVGMSAGAVTGSSGPEPLSLPLSLFQHMAAPQPQAAPQWNWNDGRYIYSFGPNDSTGSSPIAITTIDGKDANSLLPEFVKGVGVGTAVTL